jgi:hypothetical protein
MNEKQLRALVREEVESVLTEEAQIDSHPKFRRLVEAKLGRKFANSDEHWDLTYMSWSSALQETDGRKPDKEVVDFYVNEAAKKILPESAHQHMEEVTWDDVKRWAPDAFAAAMQNGYTALQPFLFEPLDSDDPTVDVDGEPWVLHIENEPVEFQDPEQAYDWDPDAGEWMDLLYHS